MSRPENAERAIPVQRFVRQETVSLRGKSSCFATSIVNAAIGLGAVTLEEAQREHTAIVDQLVAIPDLWDGAIQRIQTLDPRIAEIVESRLPIHVGFDSEVGRLMIVQRNFGSIWRDVGAKETSHVVIAPHAEHAYAVVGVRLERGEPALEYVDPLLPFITYIGENAWFNTFFRADNQGLVNTTPVRKR